MAASLTYIVIKFVDLMMGLWQQPAAAAQEGLLDHQLFPIIRKTLKIFVLVVAVLVTTQNLGMNVTGLLASLSIGGLAMGLAAQDTLSNLFGAVPIFADKPFRVGDRIQLDTTIDGTVEVIGLRSTRVRNLDGFLVTIPNRTMANANIINVSKRPNIKTVMNIGVTYDTSSKQIERAMQIIEEIYRPHPKTADLEPAQVVQDPVEPVVPELRVGLGRASVERDVEVDGPPQQPLDVAVGEDLAVRGHLQHLPAVAERVEQVVEVLHHERLADRAVHEVDAVVEERPPLRQRLQRERRVDVVTLQTLVVVPLAIHARGLDVADAVEVDAEAHGRGLERGAALEHFVCVPDAVGLLPGHVRVPDGILVDNGK